MLHMLDTLPPDEINFGTLFRWANYSGGQLTTLLSAMAVSTSHRGVVGSIISGFFENMTGGGEKETSGILSTIRKGLSPFKNPQLQEATEASDFDLSVLTEKQAGIYICLQQYQMEANAVWMRVIIGAALKYMQRHYSKERRVLFLLDEFPTLGYMKDIEQNMGFIAGYNVSFWIIVQSLVQLQKLYPNSWEVFTANALVQHFLGIGDLTTAKYVSERLPEVVSILRHEAEVREIKKRLLSPDEVINFPGIILLLAGCSSPIQFQKMPYYTTEPYRSAADPNPFI
jgi:type IV secretion system protein VirD4